MIEEACRTLKRNREQYLRHRSTDGMVKILCEIAANWLQPDNSFRKLALELGPAETGFSRATLAKGLDNFFRRFTPENFRALFVQELGDTKRLDKFVATRAEENSNRAAMAIGPEFLVHIAAGNIPNPA